MQLSILKKDKSYDYKIRRNVKDNAYWSGHGSRTRTLTETVTLTETASKTGSFLNKWGGVCAETNPQVAALFQQLRISDSGKLYNVNKWTIILTFRCKIKRKLYNNVVSICCQTAIIFLHREEMTIKDELKSNESRKKCLKVYLH